ncbi:MAG TPA: hypothetical protein VNZ22_03970 [Bacillota bacterium]|nr:hypothetical protein [Bacillota bacterium]
MATPDNRQIVIRTPDGKYLSGDANGLRLVHSVYEALLIDPERIPLEATLAELRRVTGLAVELASLDLAEVFETCDRCGQQVTPLIAYFDGRRFLCPDCSNRDGAAVSEGKD